MATSGAQIQAPTEVHAEARRSLRSVLFVVVQGLRKHAPEFAEIGIILVWAAFVGRDFLALDPKIVPWGAEFPMVTQSYYVWNLLTRCGACIFWNGYINGGAPAFVDLHGALLHPLTIVTTLIWGVVDGAKVTMVISLFVAGLAQWWLAKTLRIGLVARLWSAGLVVVGGHLFGRMQNGLVTVVLSLAFGALLIPAILNLTLRPSRRSAATLGVLLALTLVSGQGYIQIGAFLGLLPAALIYWFDDRSRVRLILGRIALAAVVAGLLTAVLWIPLLHFLPNIVKSGDPAFSRAQPFEYVPLNLVIRDRTFYDNTSLGKLLAPVLYLMYIGWVPVLLALLAVAWRPQMPGRTLAFLLIGIALIFFFSSSTGMSALSRIVPGVDMILHPSLAAGLAVPLIMALAAWGADALLRTTWLRLKLLAPSVQWEFNAAYLVLALPLLLSIKSAYDLSQEYLWVVPLPAEYGPSMPLLQTQSAEWVSPPFGEYLWYPILLGQNRKLGNAFRPWQWKGRDNPPLYVDGSRDASIRSNADFVAAASGVFWMVHSENEYASVRTPAGQVPCSAQALGGNIDVECSTEETGTLVIYENYFPGWTARLDSAPVSLLGGAWIATQAPAGRHHYTFRYRPWDVWLGFALWLVGIALTVLAARSVKGQVTPVGIALNRDGPP